MPEAEVHALADELLAEKDPARISKYLEIFSVIPFPFEYHILFRFAKRHGKSIADKAVHALTFFSGNDIRALALEKLHRGQAFAVYLELLVNNYRTSDALVLTELVRSCRNQHKCHELIFYLIKIYKANRAKSCRLPLVAIYHKTTCGICRSEIIGIMLRNDVLPAGIWREIPYDSLEETRLLGRNAKGPEGH